MEQLLKKKKRINIEIGELLDRNQIDYSLYDLIDREHELLYKKEHLSEKEKKELQLLSKKIEEKRKERYYESERISRRLNELYKELDSIEEEIIVHTPAVATGDRLELKKEDSDIRGKYLIYLKGTSNCIGYISYSGYHASDFFGDVGVTIEYMYRGNNYFYEALNILSDLLYKNGIIDFWITAYKDNIPSVRTIQKYGGIQLESENPRVFIYDCKTKEYESTIKRSK